MLRAYHDRSDGGLFVTLLEMAFAGHCGLDIALPAARGTALAQLFSEEPGVVVQILAGDEPGFAELLARHELADAALYLGAPVSELRVQMKIGATQLDESWADLRRAWSETSWRLRRVREEFQRFFARPDSFALGICNGCQMFAALRSIIPGSGHWPRFVRNRSEQYEARFSQVEVLRSPSVLLAGMAGSILPIAVAHGEGRAEFESAAAAEACAASGLVGFCYVNPDGGVASAYPCNPSGTPFGIAALSNLDGRVTITMPHPERSFRYVQNSWRPRDAGEHSGWMRLFRNARRFVD